MEIAIIVVLVIAGLVVLLKVRSGSGKNATARSPKTATKKAALAARSKQATINSFPAVSIQFGASACQAVTGLQDQRFLTREAPKLPLDNCNSANCTCKYTHHEIRREHDEDRRAPGSLQTTLYASSDQPERRKGGRRRSSDPR